ncbi:MAG: septation protein A [Betaproteobacteria bacterium]|nr:septation protein A [Betaproteobacteria bacterium]
MKIFFDLFPVVLFFIAYQWHGIYWATAVAIVSSILQIVFLLLFKKRVEPAAWIGLVVIVLFGGLTLWTKVHPMEGINPTVFIRWKPTVLYWIFAAILFLGPLLLQKNPMRGLLGKELHLPETLWGKVNLAWAIFFTFLGALNLYVAFHYPEPVWVKFKLFGLLALMIVFIVAQGILLAKHINQPND